MGLICDYVTRKHGKDKVVFTIIIGNIINGLGEKKFIRCVEPFIVPV